MVLDFFEMIVDLKEGEKEYTNCFPRKGTETATSSMPVRENVPNPMVSRFIPRI